MDFISHLRVDKQIVPLLSKSTYHKSFSAAIRELVSNAYDADALTVKISINRSLTKIQIEDDGNGMTKDEFDYFCTIAGQKRDVKKSRNYGRRRIGQFGIGFLAIFPYCNLLEIETTVENSAEILTAQIPAIKYFQKANQDVEDIPIHGQININSKLRLKHYTKLRLIDPTTNIFQYFTSHKKKGRTISVNDWDSFDKFKWELQEDLPITYPVNSKFNEIMKYDEPIGISVYLNDERLYRNQPCKNILIKGSDEISGIEYKYVITNNEKSIEPAESRGLKLRLNNVGIGQRTDLGLKNTRGFTHLHWLNGDVLITSGLDEFLNISRDDFITNFYVEQFKDNLREKLREQAYFVDEVANATKELESLYEVTKKESVKPKIEILEQNIKILEEKGYKIERIKTDLPIKRNIIVDNDQKLVVINNSDKVIEDDLKMFGKKYKITYSKWNFLYDEYPAVKFKNDNSIEINMEYPLFKSKQYGNIFKKFHIMLLVSLTNNNIENKKLYEKITKNFLNEFNEFGS